MQHRGHPSSPFSNCSDGQALNKSFVLRSRPPAWKAAGSSPKRRGRPENNSCCYSPFHTTAVLSTDRHNRLCGFFQNLYANRKQHKRNFILSLSILPPSSSRQPFLVLRQSSRRYGTPAGTAQIAVWHNACPLSDASPFGNLFSLNSIT